MTDEQLQEIITHNNLSDIPIIYVLRVLTIVLDVLEE